MFAAIPWWVQVDVQDTLDDVGNLLDLRIQSIEDQLAR